MGYYWNQGCADETKTAQWYVEQYTAMHENLKNELAFDFNNDQKMETFEFSNICLELQEAGANNINLVTPTMFVHKIREGLILAKKMGLKIPIVYNTSSYENTETIKKLNNLTNNFSKVNTFEVKIWNKTFFCGFSALKKTIFKSHCKNFLLFSSLFLFGRCCFHSFSLASPARSQGDTL